MVVAFSEVELRLQGSHSLKEKRQIVQSILGRLRARTPVSASEVEARESWSRAVLGIAVVAAQATDAEKAIEAAIRLIESHGGAELVHAWTDFAK